MPALLDEHAQYIDVGGFNISNGTVYIGVKGADPEISPKTIYSDRALTVGTILPNPQTTGTDGRTVNKIWVSGQYSITIKDEDDAIVYTNLDNGSDDIEGVNILSNVVGVDTITADASEPITAYTEPLRILFKAVGINTGAMTINIDGVGAVALVRKYNEPIVKGQILENQIVIAVYNSSLSKFEWENQHSRTNNELKGADVASASALPLINDGNYNDITGSVAITSINSVGVGTTRKLHFDASLTLTHHATDLILNNGGKNIVTEAGDEAEFVEYATGDWRLLNYRRASGPDLPASWGQGTKITHTTTTNLSFPAGSWRDSTDTVSLILASAIGKLITSTFTAGDGNGGLDTGTAANNTWYYLFLIKKDSDGAVDGLFSTSPTGPTMPSGYTYFRRVGSRKTDGSAVFLPVVQGNGGRCYLTTPILDVSSFNTAARTSTLLPSVPPIAGITAMIEGKITDSANERELYVTSLNEGAHQRRRIATDKFSSTEFIPGYNNFEIETNDSGQIGLEVDNVGASADVYTLGWIDDRGIGE